MDKELSELKKELRALVVSSPSQVDVRSLLRDYRKIVGGRLPIAKYGYCDPVKFLVECCSDSFQFQGPSDNPILILIVTDNLKNIDKLVRRQRISGAAKVKERRQSVQGTSCSPTVFTSKSNNNKTEEERIVKDGKGKKSKSTSAMSADTPKNNNLNICTVSQTLPVKANLKELVFAYPEGIWFTDLLTLYRERFGKELKYYNYGYTSLSNLVLELGDEIAVTRPSLNPRDWLLRPSSVSGCQPKLPQPTHLPYVPWASRRVATHHSDEDALPGDAIESGVFPEDCMEFLAHIPPVGVEDITKGAMLGVLVSELYSPSHFWIQRLGEGYSQAVEELMDDMDVYYRGEGSERSLSVDAVRVGYYAACKFMNSWHRVLIVRVMDSNTVKVRYVDYCTVCTVKTSELRPLLRRFAALPTQAIRARLGGVRPVARGRRWPHSAGLYLLDLVRDRHLVACVQAVDLGSSTLEVQLVDTSGDDDVYLAQRLLHTDHADHHPRSLLQSDECYLLPTFDALEGGHTLSFSEIHECLRYDIDIDFLDDYRRHVAPLLPSSSSVALAPSPAEAPLKCIVPLQPPLPLSSAPLSLPLSLPAPTPPNPPVNGLAPEVYKRFLALNMVDSTLANRYMVDEIMRAQMHNADLPADCSRGWAAGTTPSSAWSLGPAPHPAWSLGPAPRSAWVTNHAPRPPWGPTPGRTPPGFVFKPKSPLAPPSGSNSHSVESEPLC